MPSHLLLRDYLKLLQVCKHSLYHHCVFGSEIMHFEQTFYLGYHLTKLLKLFLKVKQPQQLKTTHMGLVLIKPPEGVCFPKLEPVLHQKEFQ